MKITMILLLWSIPLAAADWYSEHEVEAYLSQKSTQSAPLTQQFLTSKTPENVINDWLNQPISSLEKEHQLFQLLNHLATMPPTDAFNNTLAQLAQYQTLASKSHEESPGSPTAIFPIASRAQGIQNIWHAKKTESLAHQIIQFSDTPWHDFADLLNDQRRATFFGIKSALQNQNNQTIQQLSNQLQNHKWNPVWNDVAVFINSLHQDDAFSLWLLKQLPTRGAEQIYRQWADAERVDLLLQPEKSAATTAFVTSLLSSFQHQHPQVVSHLIKKLSDPEASSGAAFALSKNNDPKVWQKLSDLAEKHPELKNTILFSLKQNHKAKAWLEEAQ